MCDFYNQHWNVSSSTEFLQKYTPCVERLGFDENFIDASELVDMRLQDGAYKEEFVGHVYHENCEGSLFSL